MTSLAIEIMLHHYCCYATPWPRPSPSATNEQNNLVRDGLIEPKGIAGCFVPTERGFAYVEMLRNVPLPVQKWGPPE